MLSVPVASLWMAALTTLLCLIPGAAYVSVINDITDREDDLAAGKTNRTAGLPRIAVAGFVLATIAAGVTFAFLWRHDPLLLAFYLAAWLAFSLYSLPPFRFKTRGILGVLADASGAHLFPTLVAVVLVFRAAGRAVDPSWLVAVAVWAFGYGLRGILWHQLSDHENDRAANVRTFVQRRSPRLAAAVGEYVAFPLEITALLYLIWRLQSVTLVMLLVLYVLFVLERMRRWHIRPVIVQPVPGHAIVLQDFYDVLYPLGVLAVSASIHPRDVVAIGVHLLLFPRGTIQFARDARSVVLATLSGLRRRWL